MRLLLQLNLYLYDPDGERLIILYRQIRADNVNCQTAEIYTTEAVISHPCIPAEVTCQPLIQTMCFAKRRWLLIYAFDE